MASYLLVVEGSHDAAFFGHILRPRGYTRVEYYGDVPEHWRRLIPEKYPIDAKGYLGKVISFPEFYKTANGDHSIAISVAGSDANLVNTLRTPIELLDLTSFSGIGVALDADWKSSAAERFAALEQRLEQVNAEAVADGLVGFPLMLPNQAGVFVDGPPRLGIHVFPDNNSQGTLENVLLACVATNHPVLHDRASRMLTSVDADCLQGDEDLKSLRTQSGKYKAHAGVISNVLRPGLSLAVSLFSSRWLDNATAIPGVQHAEKFVEGLIGP